MRHANPGFGCERVRVFAPGRPSNEPPWGPGLTQAAGQSQPIAPAVTTP